MTLEQHDQTPGVPEHALYPFTTGVRRQMWLMLLFGGGFACTLAVVQREVAWYGPAAFFILAALPMELVFRAVRRRRMTAYCNGEDCVATVVKKGTVLRGPQYFLVIRYSLREAAFESRRLTPLRAWLRVGTGDSVPIRVDRDDGKNWVFCWTESHVNGGAAV
jgi:hypothetical protein